MDSSIPLRLKRARVARGHSLEQLATLLGNITKQGLSKYESGALLPNSARLIQFARALGVKPEYFLRSDEVELLPLEFRKLAKMPAYRQMQVRELMRDHLERYVALEQSLESYSANKLPPAKSIQVATFEQAEEAAVRLRQQWGVGNDAIANLIDLLEHHGFKVMLLDAAGDFDGACAATTDGGHVIFALNGNRPGERMRFTLAHELGHWLMDLPISMDEKGRERCCHRFAAALLFPSKQVKAEFGDCCRQRVHVQEILNAKQSYGVSMHMIIYRLKDLNLLSPASCQKLYVEFGRRGWRKQEPGALPPERPRRFETMVYRGIAEEVLTLSRAAELLQVPLSSLSAEVFGVLVHG